MIKNYIKIAVRSLMRHRLVSFINIFGLGLSMSVGMMVMVILQDELSYDHFHPHPERTFRIISTYQKKGGAKWKMASTPLPLCSLLKEDTAEIEDAVNLYPALDGKATAGSKGLTVHGAFTTPSFFTVFGFTLVSGDAATALQQPNNIVLARATAEKFFGSDNAIGKVITIEHRGTFIVTGVLADIPGKSHIHFDAYAPVAAIPQLIQSKQLPDKLSDWGDCMAAYTYVLQKEGAGNKILNGQLNGIAAGINKYDHQGKLSFATQPIEKITPSDDNTYNDIGGGTGWGKLWIDIGVALLILVAACFNYTNLTVARALTRAKEVGIRKISGAKRHQIFTQYVVEACLLAFLALGFAWILFAFIVTYAPFNDNYEMIPSTFRYNRVFVFCTFGFAVFTGLMAGAAPAWILSAFKPLRVLKNLSTAKIFGNIGLQKTLIVFQYSLSLIIIIFLFAFYRQFAALANADPGFQRENVLVVPLEGLDEKIAANTIAATGGIRSVSGLSTIFSSHFTGERGPAWIDLAQKGSMTFNNFFADMAFIPAMKIQLLAGRNFSGTADNTKEHDVIINAKAAQYLGFKRYDKALGQKLWVNDSTRLEIVGVVNDFIYENAASPIDPIAIRNKKNACNYLYVGVEKGDKPTIVSRVERALKTLSPSQTFVFTWLDDTVERISTQHATLSLLGYLAFMTVTIASLGLLGLVIYSVEIKRKEISIRKVIGANGKQLVAMLSLKFVKLLLIAGAIGLPIGYTLSHLFQLNFAIRPGYAFISAVACFILLLTIGLFTIISQTYKASREKPTNYLKVE